MSGFSFRKNMVFDWDGCSFRIERMAANGEVLLEALDTGNLTLVPQEKILSEYGSGSVLVKPEGVASGFPSSFCRPMDELSEKVRAEFTRRKKYIDRVLRDGPSAISNEQLRLIIQEVALEISDPLPPSSITIYRWKRRYLRNEDSRALIPRHDLRGPRKEGQETKLYSLLCASVEEAFKASPAATLPYIYAKFAQKIQAEQQTTLDDSLAKVPSLRTVYRWVGRLGAYEIYALRNGVPAAEKKFRSIGAGVKTSVILERVEIDHTPLDLFLVDEKTGLPLGRPTLTVLIDHFSRMLLGYYLSYGDPSTEAVMGALRHAVLPKQRAESSRYGLEIDNSWVCYGKPDVLVVDNGLEFHGRDLESVAYDLGIRIQYCPKHEPRFKGVVERFLKTINYFFAHQLPGTSLAKWHLRGDYDPQKSAILTLSEFKHIFEKWVVDIYAQRRHRGIGTTPAAMWRQGLLRRSPELPQSRDLLNQRIGNVTQRSLRATGIELHGIRYNGDALTPILRAYGIGVTVRVLYHAADLGEIQVWGPDSSEPVSVRAIDYAYASGLTAIQNKMIRQYARDQGMQTENKADLDRAYQALMNFVESLMRSRRHRDRRNGAKIQGPEDVTTKERIKKTPSRSGEASTARHKSPKVPYLDSADSLSPTNYPKFSLKNEKGVL